MGRAFLIGLGEPWSIWDTHRRPLLYQRLGQAAEREGDTVLARDYYQRLAELWQACDPALVAERDAVEARLEALDR